MKPTFILSFVVHPPFIFSFSPFSHLQFPIPNLENTVAAVLFPLSPTLLLPHPGAKPTRVGRHAHALLRSLSPASNPFSRRGCRQRRRRSLPPCEVTNRKEASPPFHGVDTDRRCLQLLTADPPSLLVAVVQQPSRLSEISRCCCRCIEPAVCSPLLRRWSCSPETSRQPPIRPETNPNHPETAPNKKVPIVQFAWYDQFKFVVVRVEVPDFH
ncbi:uncharacterized protein LOC121802373 [Salvia splendens]|uniref:uncharacterized protein LOC121802373 n=1 Tax=Salvia splendens TaxID=180675 RepID=UPI001C2671BC|nr:uncharacterized protein LOC121802373 [Salvia splendens]